MKKKNILLLYDNRELDRQVLRPVNYGSFERDWVKQNGGNSGNKLYNTAVEQYLTKEDIVYSYYTGDEPAEQINEKYDMAVFTTANIFNANPAVTSQLEDFAALIGQFKIPVYILGCGLQCAGYEDIKALAEAIKKPARAFLEAVYRTGGELALRGYATKEFLDAVMPNTAVVTGCPSFYQRGGKLTISNDKVSEEQFKPSINGNLKYLKQIGMLPVFDQYKNSIYMDQDEFAPVLYFHDAKRDGNIFEITRKKTFCGTTLLAEDRIRLLYDVPVWLDYFKQQEISFSCGSRIHGNIAATLAGVPAKVIYRDARTRELAEFFELPVSAAYDKQKSLYQVYLEADYTKFNQHFHRKFEAFEEFMTAHGISHDLEDRSLFQNKIESENWTMPVMTGQGNIDRIRKQFHRSRNLCRIYENMLDKLRRG